MRSISVLLHALEIKWFHGKMGNPTESLNAENWNDQLNTVTWSKNQAKILSEINKDMVMMSLETGKQSCKCQRWQLGIPGGLDQSWSDSTPPPFMYVIDSPINSTQRAPHFRQVERHSDVWVCHHENLSPCSHGLSQYNLCTGPHVLI